MSVADWSEERLRLYIQEIIDRAVPPPELPQPPVPYVDDLLKSNGVRWQAFTVPAVRVWRATTQSIGPGAGADISFSTEIFDTESEPTGMWDLNNNPTRLTAMQQGVYIVVARLRFSDGATGLRAYIQKTDVTGANTIVEESNAYTGGGGTDFWVLLVTLIDLARNEYVVVHAMHDALATVDVETQADRTPIFSMAWVAPLYRQPAVEGG